MDGVLVGGSFLCRRCLGELHLGLMNPCSEPIHLYGCGSGQDDGVRSSLAGCQSFLLEPFDVDVVFWLEWVLETSGLLGLVLTKYSISLFLYLLERLEVVKKRLVAYFSQMNVRCQGEQRG